MNLREQIPIDQKTIENDWGLPVVFYSPSGAILNSDAETGETLKSIQILYPALVQDIGIGEIITRNVVVVMRRSALSEIPSKANYNSWIVAIPETPSSTATLEKYKLEQPREGGESLEFIRFYLKKLEQSS